METEEEQVEKLKAWFKENGLSIVFGVVLGGGGIVGYNLWQNMQEASAMKASDHFTKMIDSLNTSNAEGLQTHANQLISEHGGSDYALIAQLALAKNYVVAGDFDQAEMALQQIIGSAANKPLAYIARTRLAAVQIQSAKYDAAMSTLSVEFPAEFAARVAELKGDIHVLQNNVDAAAASYRIAQTANPGPFDPEFLQQKLDELGVGN